MAMKTEAWILPKGPPDRYEHGELVLTEIELPPPGDDEVIVEGIYGSWEANLTHAMQRLPLDICVHRGEEYVILGNSGVCRVVQAGKNVKTAKEGDVCLLNGNATSDQWGFPKTILGFDAPGTMGLLAKRSRMHQKHVLPLPHNSRHSLKVWAAFPVRYITAWSNLNTALACLRSQLTASDLPMPHVWGWGGGTTFAQLQLAVMRGCSATQVTGSPEYHGLIREAGIDVFDRREIRVPSYDPQRYSADEEYRREYRAVEKQFLEVVRSRTRGLGVSIFVDHIGGPLARPAMRALGRQGVICTAGWKKGMEITSMRAAESIGRHIHVHTHGWRAEDTRAAMEYAEYAGWAPSEEWLTAIYPWEKIPDLATNYEENQVKTYFPLFEVNPE